MSIYEFWYLFHFWLRIYRSICQEKLSLYLGFFQFMNNIGIRVNRST